MVSNQKDTDNKLTMISANEKFPDMNEALIVECLIAGHMKYSWLASNYVEDIEKRIKEKFIWAKAVYKFLKDERDCCIMTFRDREFVTYYLIDETIPITISKITKIGALKAFL
jgi:hypothetical protein